MIACMIPMFAVSSAAAAPKITVDGKIDDWEKAGLKTLSVVGSDAQDGKKITFYAVLTDEGIYLAADSYHELYKTTENDWWTNTNFEMFVNGKGNRDNQVWVSAKGINDTNKEPAKSHSEMTAKMVTTEVSDAGKAKYHTIVEVFLPIELSWVAANIVNGAVRVGIAWKTPGDKVNNGEANGGGEDEYWAPKGTWPDNADKAVVTAEGIITKAAYDEANPRDVGTKKLFDLGSEWSYATGTTGSDGNATPPTGWPNSVDASLPKADGVWGEGGNGKWVPDGENNDGVQANAWLFLAKEIKLTADDIKDLSGKRLYAAIRFDDDIKIYVNGTLLFQDGGWNDGTPTYALALDAAKYLKEGTNVIAVSLHQHFGGYQFNMSMYAEKVDIYNYTPYPSVLPELNASVSTANELIEFINFVNEVNIYNGNITRLTTLNITKDIDMSGKAWTPLTRYVGTIEGNGHTISNITYTTDAVSGNYGLIVRELANNNANGTVQNLTIKDSVIVATSTSGSVGAVAGLSDRGRVIGVTVDNVTVIGNKRAGGVVGEAAYQSDGDDIKVENCTVKNSTIIAKDAEGVAGGIVGSYRDTELALGKYTVENVSVQAKTASATVGSAPANKTPKKDDASTETAVNASEKIEAPALGEGQATQAWDVEAPTAVKVTVTANASSVSAVKVAGKAIKAANYTVSASGTGAAEITLTEAYLKTLKTGEYKVTVETYQGNVEFTLNVTNDEATPPQTGDIALTVAFVATVSIFALAAVVITKKRLTVK